MVSNNDEKYFSRVCIKARLISRIIFIGCSLQIFYSQIKRLKDISFHIDIENEMLCHEPGMSTVIFSSS